jgi:hypothetical protein
LLKIDKTTAGYNAEKKVLRFGAGGSFRKGHLEISQKPATSVANMGVVHVGN